MIGRRYFYLFFVLIFFVSGKAAAKLDCGLRSSDMTKDFAGIADYREKGETGLRGKDPKIVAVYGEDGRVPMPTMKPYSSVGRLTTDETICTSFLVNACTTVSVGHCYRNRSAKGEYFKNATFQASNGSKYKVQNVESGNSYDGIGFEYAFAQVPVDPNGDYVGEKLGAFTVANVTADKLVSEGGNYCLPGYSSDKTNGAADRPFADENAKVHSKMPGQPNGIMHIGDTSSGVSGAPIFRCPLMADGKTVDYSNPRVVGIHVGSPGDQKFSDISKINSENMARGLASAGFFEELKNYIIKYPCRDEKNRPQVRGNPQVAARK